MIPGPPLSSSSSSTTITDSRLEPQQATTSKILQRFEFFAHAHIDQATALGHNYAGNGTVAAPFVVEFLPSDPQDATTFSTFRKWIITTHQAVATLAVTFASSAYSGGIREITRTFEVSHEVATLGVSLYVLGFAIGPLLWAPLSELYGRQRIFVITMMAATAFNAGAAGVNNMSGLLVLRFFAGASGSSTLTNAGGVIADMFNASHRGLATSVFAMAPFLGPAIGPIVGGFLSETEGWRWLHGLMAIFTGALWILGTLFVPETYAPVLLRRRAQLLSKITGRTYISTIDAGKPPTSLTQQCKTALTRPWILLFKEPIVLLTSVYIAIIYGTLYLNFAAFPIVFQVERGWSPGIGGLPFIGTAVGVVLATLSAVLDNKRYTRLITTNCGMVEPEARVPPAMVGSIMIPVGLFWFAWTCGATVHWIVPIVGSAFFACGLVMVFLSLLNYLIDSYVVYSASILAANSILRSLFGAAFPLFTEKMYENLGIHWASSIPAFLALACVPFPFLFYKYGGKIRMKCEYASEAAKVLQKMRTRHEFTTEDEAMVGGLEVSVPQRCITE